MDESVFSLARWRERFKTDERVVAEQRAEGHAPDATPDEVGVPKENIGWEGRPLRSPVGNGQGSGTVGGPGWAGWAANSDGR